MLNTSTDKEQFYSKLKAIKKSRNRLISREHLEVVKKYLSDQHQQNFSCNDDVDPAVAKRTKKIIKRNKFSLVNKGAETCTLKQEAGVSEETGEIGNSGDKVGSYLCKYLVLPSFKMSVSGRFLVLATGMQLGDVTIV